MRIVTWNCCRGAFYKKVPVLNTLSPDIAIIQECGQPSAIDNQCLWFGDNPKQGIAVVAKAPYQVRAMPLLIDVPKYAMPVQVVGPVNFIILAIWAKGRQKFPYIEGVVRAVEMYSNLLADSTAIIIGDFNSNTIWYDEHPCQQNHSALVRRLSEIGMISSYHAFHGVLHGKEKDPTHYFRWNEQQPYHIDYAFIPSHWLQSIQVVAVGSYRDWKDYSDHRPLLVDFGKLAPTNAPSMLDA